MPIPVRILTLRPNPASDSLTVEGTRGMDVLLITDMQGRVVLSEKLTGWDEYTVSLKGLKEGNYLLTLKKKGIVAGTGKFVISR